MRIAIVSTMKAAPWGGSEFLWAEAARNALQAGHEVALSVQAWPHRPAQIKELAESGAMLFERRGGLRYRVQRRLESRFPMLGGAAEFRPLMRWRPDVVCISMGGMFDMLSERLWWTISQLRADHSTPYVSIVHGSNDRYCSTLTDSQRIRTRDFIAGAAQACFVSDAAVAMMERQLAVKLKNSLVLRNPVNLRETDAVAWPAGDMVRIANVSRLDVSTKGHDILLEILSRTVWRDRLWHCTFFGDGPSRRYFEELIEFYELGGRVTLAGHGADIRAIWANHHLNVMPSRSEGVPLSLVEAMLCGRPSVITDVGGVREWIADGQNGMLAEAATAHSFSVALERAWQCRDKWPEMGRHARQTALERVDPAPGERLLKVLETAAFQPS